MEIRKIFRAGNSLVISLPQRYLQKLGLKEGDQVTMDVQDKKNKGIVITPLGEALAGKDDLSRDMGDFLESYGDALEKLEE